MLLFSRNVMWFWGCTSSTHLVLYAEKALCGFGVQANPMSVSIFGSDCDGLQNFLCCLICSSVLRDAFVHLQAAQAKDRQSEPFWCFLSFFFFSWCFTVILSTPFPEPFPAQAQCLASVSASLKVRGSR